MAALIASVNSVTVTPTHIKPGDSVSISVSLKAGSRKLTGLKCALYGTIGGVNYLATPLIDKTVNIAANATSTVTFTATASAQSAQVDGRITAYAAGANNSIHDVPLLFGFREVESNISSGGSVDSQKETASVGQFLYETETEAGGFGKHYNPTIEYLNIERSTYDSEANVFRADDEGVRALVSCVLSMDDPDDDQHFACLLTWGSDTAQISHSHGMTIHNRTTDRYSYADREWFGEGMTRNIWPLFDYEFPKATATVITCTYGDDYESDTVVFTLSPAFANVNLSGTGKGVAFGKFSASTEGNPLFECEYPAQFSDSAAFGGNIAVGSGKLLKVVNVTVASSLSIAAGASADCTATVNPGTGWTPVCTTGTRCNNGRIVMRRAYLSGTTVHVEPVNTGTSTYTIGIQADVLCIRTSL